MVRKEVGCGKTPRASEAERDRPRPTIPPHSSRHVGSLHVHLHSVHFVSLSPLIRLVQLQFTYLISLSQLSSSFCLHLCHTLHLTSHDTNGSEWSGMRNTRVKSSQGLGSFYTPRLSILPQHLKESESSLGSFYSHSILRELPYSIHNSSLKDNRMSVEDTRDDDMYNLPFLTSLPLPYSLHTLTSYQSYPTASS